MIFKCKNCGGNAVYNPEKKSMYCPYCQSLDSEEKTGEVQGIHQCANCGAPVEVDEYLSAGKCTHCGTYLIFDERVEGQYTPHIILPFKIGHEQAEDALKNEFGKKLFLPTSFLAKASLQKMEGMYVPFFLYDYHADYDWAGRGTKVRTWRRGNTEYTETSIYRIERNMEIDFSRIPVDASIAMEDGAMDLMEPYDYTALEAFQAKYMSGFYAERFNEGDRVLEPRARRKAERDSDSLMMQSIIGYSSVAPERRNLSLQNTLVDYALMPVWVYQYSYEGKVCTFFVNGQTGKVVGEAPVSKGKLALYSGSFFALIMGIGQMIRMIMEVI